MPVRRKGSRRNRARQIPEEELERMLRWLSPLPTPWQRWKDAGGLDKADRNEQCGNGADVAAAVDYLDALARCNTDRERATVQRRWPEISEARAIFDADNLCRWELEGYLLSGQSDKEVASRLALSPRTVATYVSLFFDLRAFVDEPEWLASKMFGSAFTLSFRDDQLQQFWAWIGICGGPVMLKKFVSEFHAAWRPSTPPLLSVYLAPDAPVALNMQALVASFILPSNAKTAPILFETHLGLIEADRETDSAGRSEKIDQLMRTMINFTRGFLAGKSGRRTAALAALSAERGTSAGKVAATVGER